MGFIKEPKGIDFIIKSKPLTDKEREAISEYIANYKKMEVLKNSKKRNAKRKLQLA